MHVSHAFPLNCNLLVNNFCRYGVFGFVFNQIRLLSSIDFSFM